VEEKFGGSTGRVVRSWLGTAKGQTFAQSLGPHRLMRQEARSYVEGLTARPFWDARDFAWATQLEANWEVVRDEFRHVALENRATLEAKGSNVWVASRDAEAGETYGSDWRTLALYDRGRWDAQNAALFPETARLLAASEAPIAEAFFASMKPQSAIKPHSDHCNFLVTSHLPLIVPGFDGPDPKPCRLSVGDQTRAWQEGQVLLFDTSILHDAVNDSPEYRYVLMLRLFHPDLSSTERAALQFLFDCLETPDLASDDAKERHRAEALVAASKQPPPTVVVGAAAASGMSSSSAKTKKPPSSSSTKKRASSSSSGFGRDVRPAAAAKKKSKSKRK